MKRKVVSTMSAAEKQAHPLYEYTLEESCGFESAAMTYFLTMCSEATSTCSYEDSSEDPTVGVMLRTR